MYAIVILDIKRRFRYRNGRAVDHIQVDNLKDSPILNLSVAKAFSILEYLAKEGRAWDLGIISQALGMHKSTAYRFLGTLEYLGYVTQDPDDDRYALGSKVVWLASTFLDRLDLRAIARSLLETLVNETRETVHLAILDKLRWSTLIKSTDTNQ